MTYDDAIKERGRLLNEVNMCKHAISEAMKRKKWLVRKLNAVLSHIAILEQEREQEGELDYNEELQKEVNKCI